MTDYSIDGFWKRRIAATLSEIVKPVAGWTYDATSLPTFTEAPITASEEFDPVQNPELAEILLVAAPGAVGKSTLARQIASQTRAVYIDLASAEPVGGNTLSGSLARSGLYGDWQAGKSAVLIDGLDEARLRVTRESFEAFLKDVGALAIGRSIPTVLFGRTGAIQDAWLSLSDTQATVAVLEIGYYDAKSAVDFAEAKLRSLNSDISHKEPQRRAIELILAKLRERTDGDEERFAGYAPVLSAVAERVASDPNPSNLIADIEKGVQPVTLQSVVSAILERERQKLSALPFEDPALGAELYQENEQLIRLAARKYGHPFPPIPSMGAKDAQIYTSALETWVAEHPFLNGAEGASAVFDAAITNAALANTDMFNIALERELKRGAAANPFLAEFYIKDVVEGKLQSLKPELVGVIYASVRAQLAIGQSASLSIDGSESEDELENLLAEVEINVVKDHSDRVHILRFQTEQVGVFRLGPYVDDVEITVPEGDVEFGPGPEAILIAPVSVQCNKLSISAPKVVVEAAPGSKSTSVFLESSKFEGSSVDSVPTIRGNGVLSASWPNVRQHPWTAFATSPTIVQDPRLDEALRRLRKFIIAFRSHSKGALKRYRGKIDHARMTKGTGQAVLNRLVAEEILTIEGPMYVLNPDFLAQRAGTNYASAMARSFGKTTIDFVSQALA